MIREWLHKQLSIEDVLEEATVQLMLEKRIGLQ